MFLRTLIIVIQFALLIFCAICLLGLYGACIATDVDLRVPTSVLSDHSDIKKCVPYGHTLEF